jgi:hypothetical protein
MSSVDPGRGVDFGRAHCRLRLRHVAGLVDYARLKGLPIGGPWSRCGLWSPLSQTAVAHVGGFDEHARFKGPADRWTLVAVWTLVVPIAGFGCSPLVALLSVLGSKAGG